jgi:hypothetical protein
LKDAGVTEVVLAINYQPKVLACCQTGTGWWSQCLKDASMSLQDPQIDMAHIYDCLQVMMDFLKEWEEKLHVKITCSQVHGAWCKSAQALSRVCDVQMTCGNIPAHSERRIRHV